MKHYLKRLEDAVKANWDRQALCNYRGEQFTFAEMAGHIARLHILFEKDRKSVV